MFSRRFFLKVVAAMAAAPAVSVVEGLSPPVVEEGSVAFMAKCGYTLATVRLAVERGKGRMRLSGGGPVELAGMVSAFEMRLPGLTAIRGTVGHEPHNDMRINSNYLVVGGRIDVEATIDCDPRFMVTPGPYTSPT